MTEILKKELIKHFGENPTWLDEEEAFEMFTNVIGTETDIDLTLELKFSEFWKKPELLKIGLFHTMCCNVNRKNDVSDIDTTNYEQEYQKSASILFKAFPEYGEYIYNCLDLGDGTLLSKRLIEIMNEINEEKNKEN